MNRNNSSSFIAVSRSTLLFIGVSAAMLIGFAVGWARYWLGFFVLIQGGVAGALLAWLIATLGRSPGDGRRGPLHPGFPGNLWYALLWVSVFVAAEPFGFGLAQPWFDPWGWVGRVVAGHTFEPVFGLSSLGGVVVRSFSLGCKGWFWVFMNLLDALLICALLMALPWESPASHSSGKRRDKIKKPANAPSAGEGAP